MTILTGDQIGKAQLLIIRKRLQLELQIPEFAKGGNGAMTLQGCRNLGFKGKTRKQALKWINTLIDWE